MKRQRNFALRPANERRWMLENTWCENCQKADLGMINPTEFEEAGTVVVEGRGRVCASSIRSVVEERNAQ